MRKERRDTIRRQIEGQKGYVFARSSLTADELRELLDGYERTLSELRDLREELDLLRHNIDAVMEANNGE